MKDNYNTRVLANKIILIPFREEFACTYMKWMQDPYIREMTASEELTMNTTEEAIGYQQSVLDDPNNCTFLICEVATQMIVGDVNMFLQVDADEPTKKQIELNIMIAEPTARRKGLALEALITALSYAIINLSPSKFLARISDKNTPSITLFQNKLKWPLESHSDAFEESSFSHAVNQELKSFLQSLTKHFSIQEDYESHQIQVVQQ